MDKRGQITIFIILGIIIVGGILIYFLFRGSMGIDGVSTEFEPVYDLYLSCLEDTASQGVSLLGEQAGYIEPPEFSLNIVTLLSKLISTSNSLIVTSTLASGSINIS